MSDERQTAGPVGVVGLGRMGLGLASSLVRSGQETWGFDVIAEQRESARRAGIRVPEEIAQLGRECATVLFALPDGGDVEAAVMALLATSVPGSLLIDCSTIDPLTTRRVAELADSKGCRFADAAMGGDTRQASDGALLFMVGARESDWPDVADVLTPLAREIVYCGNIGAGVTTKLVNNALALTIFLADVEALALARAADLDVATTLSVVDQTAAHNAALTGLVKNHLLTREFDGGFRADLAHKDVRLACTLAARLGLELQTIPRTLDTLAQVLGDGLGDRNAAALGLVVEQNTGVSLV